MKRTNPKQYRTMQKFCRDLFKKSNYISARKLSIEIQNNLSPFATRYKNYLLQMHLLTEKNSLFYPGPMLRHFKNNDFVIINKLLKIGNVDIVEDEIHFTTERRNPTFEIPEHWEMEVKNYYKRIFKIKKQN